MNKKTYFEAPQAELIVVRFEENIMSPNNSWDNPATSSTTWGDENDDNGME